MTCAAHNLASTRMLLTQDDVDLIRRTVARFPRAKPLVVVDLGAGSGTTAAAVFAERPDAQVTTYDVYEVNVGWARLFIHNAFPLADWVGYVMDSVEAASMWQQKYADLVLIDTSHEYRHTAMELAEWHNRVKPSGYVWCHDYEGDYPGVRQAVNEAVLAGSFVMVEQRGLGCVLRKA